MLLTTSLLCLVCLTLLLFLPRFNSFSVDVRFKDYHNTTNICAAGIPGFQCDFRFKVKFSGNTSNKTYKEFVTSTFPADGSSSVSFPSKLAWDVDNPLTLNMDTMEEVVMNVLVEDDDYVGDDFISEFQVFIQPGEATHLTERNTSFAYGSSFLHIGYTLYCDGNYGGVGCSKCLQDYYLPNCTKFCTPTGNLTCNNNGDLVCMDCSCTPVAQRYNCSENGTKICLGRWSGSDCDLCSSQGNCSNPVPIPPICTTSVNCSTCHGNWDPATNCSSCHKNYFGLQCSVLCTNDNDHICTRNGSRICRPIRAGTNCEKCLKPWSGANCDTKCGNDCFWTESECRCAVPIIWKQRSEFFKGFTRLLQTSLVVLGTATILAMVSLVIAHIVKTKKRVLTKSVNIVVANSSFEMDREKGLQIVYHR